MAEILTYEDRHFAGVEALWEEVFPTDSPWNKAAEAIPAKLKVQPELFIVAEEAGDVIGTVMAGYDGHRGWLYTVAVKPEHQRRGIGTALLIEAEIRLSRSGCKKTNLQIRAGNEAVAAFYRRHGYLVEERISMGKRFDC
ncbi:GNAT family acetyltransferase [Polymorphobacter multimanifer]|uniref:Ribosomal protein S18 acetylase RimI-like enzyme n=1 Tax=Polymorphobacter multimanifer TaxID=1070431 RepID=A0A841LIQ9_9SPHN|nr:GNAT family acetyltransferase [Polymorphobacter multimanifer]MBB6228848.1 ribosomal protein S18 acetylase RimI-like enzyme [Polymorphobacter multimanifer]GGI87418.1 GNAT family acetyltransferase [Polymorphobacter multimanifer]